MVLAGAEPVFADIEPGHFCLDPDAVAAAVGPRTAAVMPVHLYGHPADMDRLGELARRHGLLVAEDAAQAHLAALHGRPVGTFGRVAAFSFYSTKNIHIYQPGIAVGGHCIPVYPRLYLWNDPEAEVVRAARATNEAMPAYAVELLAREHGDLAGERVVVLGAAYRGGVKETAFSGVFGVVEALRAHGARPLVHDPLFDVAELEALGLPAYVDGEEVDAAIVQADHEAYRALGTGDIPGIRTIVGGRGALVAERWFDVDIVVLGKPKERWREAANIGENCRD